ncbi:MAG: hypothetical protein ACRC5T_06215 [Cetobacterium sp.]
MKITTKLPNMKKTDERLAFMKSVTIKVGIIGQDVDKLEDGKKLTIRQYATLNEYGTSTIPARPFFRTAVEFGDSIKVIKRKIYYETSKVIEDKKTGEQAIMAIGTFVKGRIQTSLRKGNWAPNAPSTIKRKIKNNGTLKPVLVDTGSMIKAIDFEIVKR